MIRRVLAGLVVVPFLLGAAAAPATRVHVAFTIRDPAITEASALVPLPGGLFATTNDSGDTGRVFVLDSAGATVGVTYWEAHPTDVESLAPAPDGEIWVGDTGGNIRARSTIEVAKIPVGRGERTVSPTIYPLTYPDGGHDAETLLCDPTTGRLYVATKSVLGGVLYAAPARLSPHGPNPLTKVGQVLPMATDGGFLPGGQDVIIRNYISAVVYAWPSLEPKATFLMPPQPQGEGIGFTADGRLYVSSEGRDSQVLRVPLPRAVARLASPGARLPGAGPSAGPSAAPTSSATSSAAPSPGSPVPDRVHPSAAGEAQPHRSWWPWLLAGIVGAGAIGVLVRSVRPR